MSNEKDLLHRFVFDSTDIKGQIVSLDESLKELMRRKAYPSFLNQLLGEFMTAVALLSSTLTFDGSLTLQARGNGVLPLIMAEVTHDKSLRAVATYHGEDDLAIEEISLPALVGQSGVLALIIDPAKGERYQGIVPLDADDLATCLEHYFAQSEQLQTKITLYGDGSQAAGLMLQMLPQQLASPAENQAAWENRLALVGTLTKEEILELPHGEILRRLFHEEGVRVFEQEALQFKCTCSKHRCAKMLRQLGQEELEDLLKEREKVEVDCQFCGFVYTFNRQEISQLFSTNMSNNKNH